MNLKTGKRMKKVTSYNRDLTTPSACGCHPFKKLKGNIHPHILTSSNYLIILLFCLSALLPSAMFAQTDYFYSPDGKKEIMRMKKDMALVRCTPETNKEAWVKQFNFNSSYIYNEDYIIVSFDSLRMNIENLRQNRNVADVAYALEFEDGALRLPTNRIFIKMNAGRTVDQLLDFTSLTDKVTNIELLDKYTNIHIVGLQLPLEKILPTCRNLYETGWCEYVEPSFMRKINFHSSQTNTNPFFKWQWGLKNNGDFPYWYASTPGMDIKAEEAWKITEGYPTIKIAVVDEGVQLNHPDLEDNLALELGFDACYNPIGGNSYGGQYGNDDHGTLCAGVIGAVNNEIGIIGVAPKCKIVPVRIACSGSNSSSRDLPYLDVWTDEATTVIGITYAYNEAKVDVISCSWGACDDRPWSQLIQVINKAVTRGRGGKGCVVVASVGNNPLEFVNWPARFSNVMAVASIQSDGYFDDASSYLGNTVDVVAPGRKVLTTTLTSIKQEDEFGYGYGLYFGTSLACPHVAGVAALMLSANPCLREDEVRKIIALSCEKVDWDYIPSHRYSFFPTHEYGSWNNQMGYGLVNAHKAVKYALAPPETFNVPGIGVKISDALNFELLKDWPYWVPNPIINGSYIVERYEVSATLPFEKPILNPVVEGIANGFSTEVINNGAYYMEYENLTETSVTVKTYVYKVLSTLPGSPVHEWIPTPPEEVRFHVSVAPDIATIYPELYLQNKVETSTQSYNVITHMAAGREVTSEIPVGNYEIVNRANVSIHAGESILLADGFTANLGSYFSAFIEPFFICEENAIASTKENNESVYVIGNYNVEITNAPSAAQNISENELYLKIYPNPSSGDVTIEYNLNRSEIVEITLHDNFGRSVYKLQNRAACDAGVYKIMLTGVELPAGIYFCTLKTEHTQKTEKLLMVR